MKGGLRTQFRAARDALGARARAQAAEAIGARLAGLDAYVSASRILSYASFGSEVDTRGMMDRALQEGREVVLPRIDGRELRLHAHRVGNPLKPNQYGIPEPDEASPTFELDTVDLVLVPGLAFDRRGHRLGYGGGYYDRLLRTSPHAYRVGLAYTNQVVERLPSTPQDEALDAVVSDSVVHVCPPRTH